MIWPFTKAKTPSETARDLSNIGHAKRKASYRDTAMELAKKIGRDDLVERLGRL